MPARKTTEQFVIDARTVHGDRYDYSLTECVNAKVKVVIICRIHGSFEQLQYSHTSGGGCSKCAHVAMGDRLRSNTRDFISKSLLAHPDTDYDYTHVNYAGNRTEVQIGCPIHGPFMQKPVHHIMGKGCGLCKPNKLRNAFTMMMTDFIHKARKAHGMRYGYDNAVYINNCTKLLITCYDHGDFLQAPAAHYSNKQGCPSCIGRVSKVANAWLDNIGIIDDESHREVGNLISGMRLVVDGYDPETKTVYEFHGDYWHGNPDIYESSDINPSSKISYGQLYENTLKKKQAFLKAGYMYVEMWESDWKKVKNNE
jgi:hypothetical protein